jgi:hypothetical protein
MSINVVECSNVWNGYLVNLDLLPEVEYSDCRVFMENCKPPLNDIIGEVMEYHERPVMMCASLMVHFYKPEMEGGETIECYFNAHKRFFFEGTDIDLELGYIFDEIQKAVEEFQKRGSGWAVDRVGHFRIHLNP